MSTGQLIGLVLLAAIMGWAYWQLACRGGKRSGEKHNEWPTWPP